MIELIPPLKVQVKISEGRGFGCFAIEKIEKEEVFEECYCLPITSGGFSDYSFTFVKLNPITFDNQRLNESVLAMGFGSIYNHSNTPNSDWRIHKKYSEQGKRILQFFALRDIDKGEEIFIYYGGESYWETRKNVKLI